MSTSEGAAITAETIPNAAIDLLKQRGFQLSDFASDERSNAALEVLTGIVRERILEDQRKAREAIKPQPFTKDFFSRPIPIAFGMPDYIENGDMLELHRRRAVIRLKRDAELNALVEPLRAVMNGDRAAFPKLLNEFCNLLFDEPDGLPDFPEDERPLKERAREYFTRPGRGEIVQAVSLEYRSIVTPVFSFDVMK